jgi:hypothetical protein
MGTRQSCCKILIDEIHVHVDGLSRDHRHKSHLVTTALAFGQDCSSSNSNQMGHAVGVMMDAIDARTRSDSTRDKMRRRIHPTPVRRTENCNRDQRYQAANGAEAHNPAKNDIDRVQPKSNSQYSNTKPCRLRASCALFHPQEVGSIYYPQTPTYPG